jgi:hypothetical protein
LLFESADYADVKSHSGAAWTSSRSSRHGSKPEIMNDHAIVFK